MIKGTLIADGLAVGSISIDLLNATAKIEAEAFYIDTKTGATFGSTTVHQWSQETVQAVKQLRSQMEKDLAQLLFREGGATSSATMPSSPMRNDPLPGGLIEHLTSRDDAPPA